MNKKTPRSEIASEECKGCQLCVEECPKQVLAMSKSLNQFGYNYAEVVNDNCIGCGFCFYACPEPGAITIYKKSKLEAPK